MLNETLTTGIALAIEAAAIAAACAGIILITPAAKLFTDSPGNRKVHQHQTPRSGGTAIVIAWLITLFVWRTLYSFYQIPFDHGLFDVLLFSAICIAVIGIVDDMVIFSISNGAKFLLELTVAWIITGMAGITISQINVAGYSIFLGIWGVPLSILWIAGVTNAINLVDGIDGLAGTVTLTILGCIAFLAYQSGAYAATIACMIVMGATAGFLMFNYSPAKIFLGDMGSLFLGMFIGTMSIYVMHLPANRSGAILLPMLIGIPIIDVVAAMARRFTGALRSQKSWYKAPGAMFRPDNEHMHHRLVQRGLTHNQALLVLVLFSATLSITAVVLCRVSQIYAALLILYIGGAILMFLHQLEFFKQPVAKIASMFIPQPLRHPDNTHAVAMIDLDPVLEHALQHYEQTFFTFTTHSRNDLANLDKKKEAVILGNTEPGSLAEEWLEVYRIARKVKLPFIIITESTDPVFSSETARTMLVNRKNPRVAVMHKPVYVPVLLATLNDVLHKGIGSHIKQLVRTTGNWTREQIHHEKNAEKPTAPVGD